MGRPKKTGYADRFGRKFRTSTSLEGHEVQSKCSMLFMIDTITGKTWQATWTGR